jgi:gluconolactonase
MRSFSLLLSLVFAAAAAANDELPPPSGEAIVDSQARLEKLFTRTAPISGGLTEGPAVAPDGSIYFSDIPFGADKGMILRYDPQSGKTSVFTEDSGKANGLTFDRDGFLLACEGSDGGGRCVSRWNVVTGEKKIVADKYQGKRFNACNDICLDREGRIYFSDPRYLGDEPRELEHRAVYRIDPDGTVEEVTHEVSKPNGVALSPDEKTLYVADHDNGTDKIDPNAPPPKHGDMKIYAFPLDQNGRVAGPRTTLYDFGERAGCDGMAVDRQGHIYLTARDTSRPGVLILSPAGKEVAFIPTGQPNQDTSAGPAVGLPSNVEFGIKDEANVLYVTVDQSLYRIPLKVRGYHVQYEAQ